jgi:hypothetical protein
MIKEGAFNHLFIIGIIFCMIGAFFMIEGNTFGNKTTFTSLIIGYIGIFIIANSSPLKVKKS